MYVNVKYLSLMEFRSVTPHRSVNAHVYEYSPYSYITGSRYALVFYTHTCTNTAAEENGGLLYSTAHREGRFTLVLQNYTADPVYLEEGEIIGLNQTAQIVQSGSTLVEKEVLR